MDKIKIAFALLENLNLHFEQTNDDDTAKKILDLVDTEKLKFKLQSYEMLCETSSSNVTLFQSIKHIFTHDKKPDIPDPFRIYNHLAAERDKHEFLKYQERLLLEFGIDVPCPQGGIGKTSNKSAWGCLDDYLKTDKNIQRVAAAFRDDLRQILLKTIAIASADTSEQSANNLTKESFLFFTTIARKYNLPEIEDDIGALYINTQKGIACEKY